LAIGDVRIKVLYGILHKLPRAHRHSVIRWLVGSVSTLFVAALPFYDVLRFDLWRGNHKWLGETVRLKDAAQAFAFPFLAVNIVIILVSRFLGRYLCGFVCPVGSLSRLIEWARFTDRKGHHRVLGPSVALVSSAVLAFITFAFWVDPRVFLEGSSTARGVSAVLLAGIALALFGIVQVLGLRFCRDWCPSGVYFAVLGQKSINGVEFAHPEACTECGLCDKVCPMELAPREMSGGAYRGGRGFYGDYLSNFALCIRCGDCVTACEEVGSRRSETTALRMGFLPEHARESRPPAAEPEPAAPAGGAPAAGEPRRVVEVAESA